ncbi:phosphoglucomutase (alpha-D-glucose-1,6-bisphosphate-dependent) [Shewanella rhizosphaerae]|uniref:phosphoglucomutase (alpha-D-glucose-1,6-bisphosphate-dependent) n=1 Tax=Shewanella rhizosphaerae TaxID=2864207 RepID=UPI001C65D323|nr:phosphoglucomutase (alpha-D-glucose-1,6-bisphosphate-dependent) [Shewanella rhizosphaerae]QYK14767.1 phosphoglucomutase (alpha-D-glucose-1,6-bisphosphate-dependent) [Shewanella rhizosphaerae]
MALHERAGKPAQQRDLVNIPKLMSHYYRLSPDVTNDAQKVTFGTSGHRGCAFNKSFNEKHILAIVQAVVDHRIEAGIKGPMIVGIDTHALSQAAYVTALEVLTANGVQVIVAKNDEYTPTPVVSHAIIAANRAQGAGLTYGLNYGLTDGLIITPSHNPPQDGGIKYNPPHGGPAEGGITAWVEQRANEYLAKQLEGVKRLTYSVAVTTSLIQERDLMAAYVEDLEQVIDMQAIKQAGIRIGVDPLGGSGIHYWDKIAERYGLDITLVNDRIDPAFGFMPLDKDGKIRMDCSSPYAMAGLLAHQDAFDICVGNDPDYDRHGIVCPGSGLMNPNYYLAVAIEYLLSHRPQWSADLKIGKTLVSSAMIDKVCSEQSRSLCEVPVGFKWFVDGLADASFAFGGEESAGAAFLRRDGGSWCTDKDGFILALLAAEILAVTGKTPAKLYAEMVERHGESFYKRIDSPVNPKRKVKFNQLVSEPLNVSDLGCEAMAGDAILEVLTHAPGNGAAIGGIKVVTEKAWFAARPSGTEALFKLYGESFVSEAHLEQVLEQAQQMIERLLV